VTDDKKAEHQLPASHSAPNLGQSLTTQSLLKSAQDHRAGSTPAVTRQASVNQELFDMFGCDYNVAY